MSFRVDARQAIDGLSRIAQAIPQVNTTTKRAAAQSGVDGARSKVHIITGRLRGSIRIISDTPEMTRFGSDLFYAGIEEFRPGHSYLMPEYNRLQTLWPEMFMAGLRRAF
jgi:hypothetical protein